MIVIHYAVRPFAESRHVGYVTEFAKRVPTVFVEPQPSKMRRIGPLDQWSTPIAELSAPLPAAGFHLVRMGSVVPFGRLSRLGVYNRAAGLRRIIRRLRKACPGEPIVLILLQPDRVSNLGAVPADLRVYEVRDDYAALALTAENARKLAQSHRNMLEQADLVMAVSERLVEDIHPYRPDCVLTHTGVEFETFASACAADAPRAILDLPSPRVGLVGNLNDRVDWELVSTLAEKVPEASITIVGSVYHASQNTARSVEALSRHKNVHLIGRLRQDQLPAAVAAMDVCIIPYRISPAVERINPLKFLQYLAAGKPVVTTPIPCIADRHLLASIESDPDRFVNAVREACRAPGAANAVEARRGYAQRHDWSEIAKEQLSMYRAALTRVA